MDRSSVAHGVPVIASSCRDGLQPSGYRAEMTKDGSNTRHARRAMPFLFVLLGCGGGSSEGTVDDATTDDTTGPYDTAVDARADAAGDGPAADAQVDALTDSTKPLDDGKCLPFDRPSDAVLAASKKKVFSHYFSPYPLSLDNLPEASDYYTVNYLHPAGEGGKFQASGGLLRDRPIPQAPVTGADWELQNFEKEIRTARAMGLDGFTFDMLATTGTQWTRLDTMLTAVERLKTDFRIVLMPDMYTTFTDATQLVDAVVSLAKAHPTALFKLADGRVVLAPYGAEKHDNAWWSGALSSLTTAGVPVAFVPLFSNVPWAAAMKAMKTAVPMVGVAAWGARTPSSVPAYASAAATAHAEGLLWMAPVAPQDMRPKDLAYREAKNSLAFRMQWNDLIAGDADWAQLITWNDYSESTEVSPSLRTQFGFSDLASYYTAWFKTGSAPKIVRDRILYFHRAHSTTAKPDLTKQTGGPFVLKEATPASDDIEMLAFLTAPATLEIQVGTRTDRLDAPAGLTSFRVPLAMGKPTFRVVRAGTVVQQVTSTWTIDDAITYQDLLYRAGGLVDCTRD